jgi:hypothetical protein
MSEPTFTCPVCGKAWIDPPRLCVCDYDIVARDPGRAIAQLEPRVKTAKRRFAIGLGLLLAVPVTSLFALSVIPSLVVAAVVAIPIAIAFGSVFTITGLVKGQRDGKLLAAAKGLLQLPGARSIE